MRFFMRVGYVFSLEKRGFPPPEDPESGVYLREQSLL